jgi:hypothetical protein
MKIIHQNGFTREELLTYRPIIYKNVLDSAQAIVLAMRKIGVDCVVPANRVSWAGFFFLVSVLGVGFGVSLWVFGVLGCLG